MDPRYAAMNGHVSINTIILGFIGSLQSNLINVSFIV